MIIIGSMPKITAAIGINAHGDIVGNVRYLGEPLTAGHGFVAAK